MLSRVAENIYWLARYIERAENTARLVAVNANLLFDLPRGIAPGWEPLIRIVGAKEQYESIYQRYDERQVVNFLLGDKRNPGSVINAMAAARENARTIREIMPREAWEQINELHLMASEHLQEGLSKSGRHGYLKRLILGSQTITGLLSGTMNHDSGYQFLRMGRNLERADMTTRIIDVRSGDLLQDTADLRPFENIQWVSVLKSLSGYQMYRITKQVRVARADVLRFLFKDKHFPRSVLHTALAVEHAARNLPCCDRVALQLGRILRLIDATRMGDLQQAELSQFIDELQVCLINIHSEVAYTWFLHSEEPEEAASMSQRQSG